MKLKSLEIEGFKSFADKTVLLFDNTLTGVVGPNGCGKSNVVDAIRWVMGEQSAKHLRGKHMEDVIFAGASSRGAGSVAGVELVFSTEGAETPPQYAGFDEISVGRKLYRTGESEYFINKQPVRLKDVKDLFLGTGIGSNAYSIIEQGSIGQLVTAKPEDRRRVVEEAAGISKFQVRKEAALRKMESTQQNLLRLKDIIAELDRQKNTLERQAKKAEKFKVIRDELQALDFSLASFDYDKFNTRQETILAEMKDLDARHVASESALQEGEARFEEARLTQVEREREVSDLRQIVFECDNALQVAEAKLQNKREEITRLEREEEVEKIRIADLKVNLEQTRQSFIASDERAANAELDYAVGVENVESLEMALAETQTAANELFQNLENGRRNFHESSKKLVEIENKILSATERLENLEQKLAVDTTELDAVIGKHRRMTKLLQEAQEQLAGVRQMKLSLGERAEELARQLQESEIGITAEQNDLDRIKSELLQKKSRYESLRELERNFEGYQDGPKAMLERKRSGELDAIFGSVADFVETDPQYEGAVSAVLGERAQFLVVGSPTQSVECAGMLKSIGSGRGSFVPLELIAAESSEIPALSHDMAAREGVAGMLSDFVRAKEGFEPLKKVFFGDVLLVDRLERAFDVWSESKRPVVTFEGEYLSRQGVLSGGSLEKTSKALFEKKREIRELDVEINDLVGLVKAKEEACFDLQRKLKMLKSELDDMKTSCHEEDLKIAGQEKDLAHCQSEIDALNGRSQQLSRQIQDAERDVAELKGRLDEWKSLEVAEKAVLQLTEDFLNEKKSAEEDTRRNLAEQSERLTREKISLAQAQERRSHAASESERLRSETVRLQQEIVASEERLALAERMRLFNIERLEFAEKNIAKLLEDKTQADEAHAVKRAEFEELTARVLEHEVGLKELRREVSQLKEVLNQKALELTELRNQLTRLQEQTYERYQVMLPEIFRDHLGSVDDIDYADKKSRADDLRGQMMRAGSVNLGAIDELKEVTERFDFLDKQRCDLEESLASLEQAIQKINETTKIRFQETFELINKKFSQLFPKLFEGGEAYLKLSDPENILETGVEIIAQPPGKKLQSITLLSGGEKALTAVSLLFAIFLIKPSPFCLLDEVDAPLDDANVDRYNEIVREMSQRTQFIVITHNKRTMQVMDSLYGVTMEKSGISQLVSVTMGD